MKTLETIFSGLNGIVSQYYSNQNVSIKNQALNQYNQQLLAQLNNNNKSINIPTILTLVAVVVLLIVIIRK